MSKSSSTNYPNGFLIGIISFPASVNTLPSATGRIERYSHGFSKKPDVLLGGFSSEVPPLPIPNREVKLTNADGTALIVWESR